MSTQAETLTIEGMSCGHCVASVKNALAATAGVEVKHVEIGTAQVNYNTTEVSHAQLVAAVEDVGFTVAQ
ncbi:MAG: cation transporter [Rhodothermales bacterium]